MAEATGAKRRGWLMILLSVAALIALGFAAYALVVSWSGSRSDDARRVRDLAIAADNIETWPKSAEFIGKSNLYHKDMANGGHELNESKTARIWLHHPDLADFQVEYLVPDQQKQSSDKTRCDDKVEIADNTMTVKGLALSRENVATDKYQARLGKASWFRPEGAKKVGERPICFSIAGLDLKAVTAVPRGFEHLLLARTMAGDAKPAPASSGGTAPAATATPASAGSAMSDAAASIATAADGTVVAHIGENKLPIRSLTELPDIQPQLLDMAGAVAQVAAGKVPAPTSTPTPKRMRRDALEPLDSSVAGTGYRFYFHPVTLKGGGQYLLVGTVRDDARPAAMRRLGPRVLAFALALFLLAALTPTLKLALLGPVDGMRSVEVGALVFGLLAAAAFATAALVFTADVIGMRAAASQRLSQSAASIRTRTLDEIHRVLLGEPESFIGLLSDQIKLEAGSNKNSVLIGRVKGEPIGLRDFPQPDSLFPIARSGRQADRLMMATARDLSGAGFELNDRHYFIRARNGDFAPGSENLVRKMKALGGVWSCVADGAVFEQVRSRPDGVPKTVAAFQVADGCKPLSLPPLGDAGDLDENRGRLQALGVSLVLKSLLAPPLHEREQFAVLDASDGAAGLPVLYHSERGRAGIERFADALGDRAKRGLAAAAATRPACAQPALVEAAKGGPLWKDGVETFSGRYEGAPNLFAATRLPCTDWMIVTFVPRDVVDGYATMAGVFAVEFWVGLLILAIVALVIVDAIKRAATDRPAWLWLWPDPNKRERYRSAIAPLAVATVATALVTFLSPRPWVAALGGPLLAGATLYGVLAAGDHAGQLRKAIRSRWGRLVTRRSGPTPPESSADTAPTASPTRSDPPARTAGRSEGAVLDIGMERHVACIIALMILCVSVLPVVALARDARAYFDAQQVGDDFAALRGSREQERRAIEAVALTYRKDARAAPAPVRDMVSGSCEALEGPRYNFGLIDLWSWRTCFDDRSSLRPKPAWSLAAAMRHATLKMDDQSRFGEPGLIKRPSFRLGDWFTFGALALALCVVLAVAFRSALRGLFGFGVVLEAVPYPGVPLIARSLSAGYPAVDGKGRVIKDVDRRELSPRFIAVAAPDPVRRAIERLTEPSNGTIVDLFAATSKGFSGVRTPVAKVGLPLPVLLFTNLEMLMRNRERRLGALGLLERAVASQMQGSESRAFDIGLISDLSPLDRLLQSYERDADELERLTPEERHIRRAELAGEREDVRWSRLFESFTTYTYRAKKREPFNASTLSPEERVIVEEVETEVAYLPDHVVAAVIPDKKPPLEPREIAAWAMKSLKNSAPRAIVDHLSSQLIEHYQLAWSVSSHAERLLLHHFAHGQLVNIGEAYALRSLVRRGLVVLDPVPRIMSRSFAQFVRHREKPETLARWRSKTEPGAWQALRTPLTIALPFALGIVAVIAIRSGESVAALLPFVVSVGPALVNFLNGGRRAASD